MPGRDVRPDFQGIFSEPFLNPQSHQACSCTRLSCRELCISFLCWQTLEGLSFSECCPPPGILSFSGRRGRDEGQSARSLGRGAPLARSNFIGREDIGFRLIFSAGERTAGPGFRRACPQRPTPGSAHEGERAGVRARAWRMVALSGITDSECLPPEMASGLRPINNLQITTNH